MPVPIPPDAQWDLGDDNLARNTRKALEAAGITPAHADRMTEHQLSLIRGLGTARLERIGASLERMRNAPARVDVPSGGDAAEPTVSEPVPVDEDAQDDDEGTPWSLADTIGLRRTDTDLPYDHPYRVAAREARTIWSKS